MQNILTIGDRKFVLKMMRTFNLKRLNIDRSRSTKKWPDIWCYPGERPPRIVVTAEWAKQNADERRKRLVHEIVGHMVLRLEHGKIGKYDFSTIPAKDTYSMAVYQRISK